MAASSASDIPDSKVDYCPCNRCTVARKQGRQEIIDIVREVHMESGGTCLQCTEAETGGDEKWIEWHSVKYPCPTIKALDDIK
jgi:hypothetical protein